MAVAASIQSILSGTKPWVRIVSIMGFISAGFMILAGLGMLAFGLFGGMREFGALGAIGLVYPLMGLIYLIPSIYLFQYASRIAQFLNGGGQEVQLELALDSQRAFWKFVGIVSVIGLVLMFLSFVAIAIPFVLGANRG